MGKQTPYLLTIQAITSLVTIFFLILLGLFSCLLYSEWKHSQPKQLIDKTLAISDSTSHQPTELQIGKDLFRNNCATCHNRNMRDNLTGPALAGVKGRWNKYPKEDLYNFIRNSQNMIKNKHPRAVQVWNENEHIIMESFPNLKDEDIDAIMIHIETIYKGMHEIKLFISR